MRTSGARAEPHRLRTAVRRMGNTPAVLTYFFGVETGREKFVKGAVEVQLLLADRGHHRAPAVPDLLIAATAELAGLTVLHHDTDFGIIADVTGQQLERLHLDE